jgi:hypothetical protein
MGIEIRGPIDDALARVRDSLQPYADNNPAAEIVIRHKGRYSIWARVIDPAFTGMARGDRHDLIWSYFTSLPDEIASDVTWLYLLSPNEAAKPVAGLEFDEPVSAQT